MYRKILCYIFGLACTFTSLIYHNNATANTDNFLIHSESLSKDALKSNAKDKVITDKNINSGGKLFSFNGSGKLIIDKEIKSIESYVFHNQDITDIEVSKDNKYFTALDGVLYNKKMTKLVYYPSLKENSTFVIPDNISKIEEYAFSNNKFLKNISIGKNVKNISWTSLEGCKADFDVDKNSVYLESENGVLFTKGKETLIKYPALKEGAYIIPESVKKIQYYALDACTGLTELTLNDNIENNSFDMMYLNGCINLEKLHLPANLTDIKFYDVDFHNDYMVVII